MNNIHYIIQIIQLHSDIMTTTVSTCIYPFAISKSNKIEYAISTDTITTIQQHLSKYPSITEIHTYSHHKNLTMHDILNNDTQTQTTTYYKKTNTVISESPMTINSTYTPISESQFPKLSQYDHVCEKHITTYTLSTVKIIFASIMTTDQSIQSCYIDATHGTKKDISKALKILTS